MRHSENATVVSEKRENGHHNVVSLQAASLMVDSHELAEAVQTPAVFMESLFSLLP
jgi:hypothetical protein